MATVDEANAYIDKALTMLQKELEGHTDPLLVMIPREQLMVFRGRLEMMAKQIADGNLPPKAKRTDEMGETIMLNWPFTYLGEAIVRAERAWRELP